MKQFKAEKVMALVYGIFTGSFGALTFIYRDDHIAWLWGTLTIVMIAPIVKWAAARVLDKGPWI